jgi:hypothetical protein
MKKVDLDPDGPHSPDRTRETADVAAETIRVLNYATLPGRGGLMEPADVHALLGTLAQLVVRLPQVFTQSASWLAGEQSAGRVQEKADGPFHGDSKKAVTSAVSALDESSRVARRLQQLLREAQNAITGLAPAGDGGDQR